MRRGSLSGQSSHCCFERECCSEFTDLVSKGPWPAEPPLQVGCSDLEKVVAGSEVRDSVDEERDQEVGVSYGERRKPCSGGVEEKVYIHTQSARMDQGVLMWAYSVGSDTDQLRKMWSCLLPL